MGFCCYLKPHCTHILCPARNFCLCSLRIQQNQRRHQRRTPKKLKGNKQLPCCKRLKRLQSFSTERKKLRQNLVKIHKALGKLNMELFFTNDISKKTSSTGHLVKPQIGLGQKQLAQHVDNLALAKAWKPPQGVKILEVAITCMPVLRKYDRLGKQRVWCQEDGKQKGFRSLRKSASCCRS